MDHPIQMRGLGGIFRADCSQQRSPRMKQQFGGPVFGRWFRKDCDHIPSITPPNSDAIVSAFRSQEKPIMRIPDTFDERSVPFEGTQELAADHRPYFHRLVLAPACERRSDWVKRCAVNAGSVAFKRVQHFPAGHLPKSHRLVLAAGCQYQPGWIKCRSVNGPLVSSGK